MANRPHPRGARTNPRSPRGWSTCMRCGFIFNAYKLVDQNQWRGLSLMSTGIMVDHKCLDRPQRQLGAIILEPDPVPLKGALPEPYAIDEYWPRLLQGGQPRVLQGQNQMQVRPRYLQVSKYFDTN